MAITIKHAKTDTIADWTQADLDAQIALGNFPPGTLLADIVLPSDWNDDHTFTGTIPIANGGTGQTTATAAINALLPSQSSQAGKVLSTDGTNTSWIAAGGVGTVTSVTGTAPVSVATGTTTPVISMAAATGSVDGYLTSTDWNTFNSKGNGTVTSITAGTGLSGGTITSSGTIAIDSTVATLTGSQVLTNKTISGSTNTLSNIGNSSLTNSAITINGTSTSLGGSINVGTVTSVGLTSSASSLAITNTPITSSGNIGINYAGIASQYVRGDGSLANFPTTGGGGSSVSYYFNGSVNQGTFGGATYYEMSKNAIFGAGTNFSIAADGYIAQFITDANDPSLLAIPSGSWNIQMYFSTSSAGGSPTYYVELYKYNGTTFTLIASNSANPEGITGGTSTDLYSTSLAVPATTLAVTDRLAIRVYVTHSGRTITLHTEGSTLCQVVTTFSTGLNALNGLTAQVQYFATGTSGSDFNISSATDTHTFNLPSASGSNRGLLTSADWTTFNSKVTSVSGTAPVVSSGGTTPAISMAKATTSVDGYLAATDFTTFNNKGNGTVTSVAALTLGTTGTDLSSTVANGTTTPVITLNVPTASATNRGVLSSADWTTFNNKGSGTVTAVSVVSANGLAGTSSGGATPALTLSTTVTGLLKGNGTAISAATSGTDYAPATSGTSILYGDGSGGFSNVTVGTGLSFSAGTLSASGGAGVTSFQTSLTGLTPSTASTGVVTLAGTLGVASGGTGLTSLTANYVPYGNGTSALANSANFTYNNTTGDQTAPQQVASNGIIVNAKSIASSYTITASNNAMSVGPVTVATGQSVTVSSGSRWVVL